MTTPRRSLYNRLPEIYHIRDLEQEPPGQLQAYLDVLDSVPAEIRDNIEALYHDFFIETCDDWVIPYLADLLGTTHLAGDPWTLRADVARTVHHRRRKGTLGAIESLTYALSGWAVHTVELRERVGWNQHLNHQRPDSGGLPPLPLGLATNKNISGAVRGGTVTLRDPALLGFINSPFDPFAHVVDLKPPQACAVGCNIPNLAIYLWRLKEYTVPVTRPFAADDIQDLSAGSGPGEAAYALRYEVHPLGEPMVLFNRHRFHADDEPPDLTRPDAVPGPMPMARLCSGAPTGNPHEYVDIDFYTTPWPQAPGDERPGLTLHMPEIPFGGFDWKYRGANLCAWEDGLFPPLGEHEIVIDPGHGRLLIGAGGGDRSAEAEPLAAGLYVSATHGFSGSTLGTTGAQPIPRADAPPGTLEVNFHIDQNGLRNQLNNLPGNGGDPVVIEIGDSLIHELDIAPLALHRSLWIRAASGRRPIIKLKQSLGFYPADVTGPDAEALMNSLNVRLEGLYITWDKDSPYFAADETPLIARAALNELIIDNCTLDPGSHEALDGSRLPARRAVQLDNTYGFTPDSTEEEAFNQIPRITVRRSICGPLAIDDGYTLQLIDSIVDAASGPGDTAPELAVRAVDDPENRWGPSLSVSGMSCFGRMRVESATGQGGIWLHRLEVHDNQQGCISFSYFSGIGDRLPRHHACVLGTDVHISMASDIFGQAGYGRLRLRSHRKILEQGPGNDAMGAFGYLLNTHKWKNINIRYREFMPVGIQPILIPVT